MGSPATERGRSPARGQAGQPTGGSPAHGPGAQPSAAWPRSRGSLVPEAPAWVRALCSGSFGGCACSNIQTVVVWIEMPTLPSRLSLACGVNSQLGGWLTFFLHVMSILHLHGSRSWASSILEQSQHSLIHRHGTSLLSRERGGCNYGKVHHASLALFTLELWQGHKGHLGCKFTFFSQGIKAKVNVM